MNWPTLIEFLVAIGFFEFVRQLATRLMNRRTEARRASLDQAQVIQGMSLKMLEPLQHQLEEATSRADELSHKLRALENEFDDLAAWARQALRLLEAHGLTVAPLPLRNLVDPQGGS